MGEERAPPEGAAAPKPAAKPGERSLHGEGEARVAVSPQRVWDMLLDPEVLASLIPGSHGVRRVTPTHFQADVSLGVGPVKGRYKADIQLSELDPPRSVVLAGSVTGGLGSGGGSGKVTLTPDGGGGTVIGYTYEAFVGGKVASVGGRLLDGAGRVIIGQFFAALARKAGGKPVSRGWLSRLLALVGIGR